MQSNIVTAFGCIGPRFILWKRELNDKGVYDKRPYQISGKAARVNHPEDWSSLEVALAAYTANPTIYAGIGVVLGDLSNGTYLVGVDLDLCRAPDGSISPWALPYITGLNSYTEVSPSKTGVKWLGLYFGTPVDGPIVAKPNQPVPTGCEGSGHDEPELAAYHQLRWFALTGDLLPDTPTELGDVTQAFIKARADVFAIRELEKAANKGKGKPKKEKVVGDRSREDYAMAMTMVRAGNTDEEIEEALRANPHGQIGSGKLQGREADRQVEKLIRQARQQPLTINLTDTGNGERLYRTHGANMRFCYPWNSWLIWDGTRWKRDESGQANELCKDTAKAILQEAAELELGDERRKKILGWAGISESKKSLQAMDWAARSLLPVVTDQLNVHKWLFNAANGTLDLQTGVLREPSRRDLMTKRVDIVFDPAALCPRWDSFLHKIMEGDANLIGYLQRAVGYALTGITTEQCLFLLHGSGSNGKSTFVDIVRTLLGEYGRATETKTFLQKKNQEGISNDIAALAGARFVSAVEIGSGRNLNEQLIKEVTGGDMITARFMRAEFFDFYPEFKLFLAVNAKPVIGGLDEGIWRRIKLIPFNVFIPKEERDQGLLEALKQELPGILAWAVRGCVAWRNGGLQDPDKVKAAVAGYRSESDLLGSFLDLYFTKGDKLKVTLAEFRNMYNDWCRENNAHPMDGLLLGRAMADRGYESKPTYIHGKTQRAYSGIGIKAIEEEQKVVQMRPRTMI